ncbi:hypothetical protein GCM10023194_58770 [Planotetraspora phitsanulokensis]|uniref:Uncharacterized protein n=1 Tax=Planotetraspora phitsanulokensis TaxID=575192 RepID=A0A8J3XL59_9ACTN|nr:hypothetical protein [Planotetraspora phitsanulokensis]GII40338.1 hypothetical protein Pph01_53410 [Planotetraspora phitsanulokensis]
MDPRVLLASALLITLPLVTLGYITACYVKPFARCWWCNGKRRKPNRIGRGWHDCRLCNGTGLRLRIGRHIWNHARRLYRDGNR